MHTHQHTHKHWIRKGFGLGLVVLGYIILLG